MIAAWLRDPRRLRLLFLATMLSLAGALGVLVWIFVQQDAQLSGQRTSSRKEASADRIVSDLRRRLDEIDALLDRTLHDAHPPSSVPDDSVVLMASADRWHAWPRERLPFFPDALDAGTLQPVSVDRADELEYRQNNAAATLAALQQLAASDDRVTRAYALQGLARNQVKAGRTADALKTYQQLAELEDVVVSGLPATFAGRLGTIAVLEKDKDRAALLRTATSIRADLGTGPVPVTRAAFLTIDGLITAFVEGPVGVRPSTALADAISEFWSRDRSRAPSGRVTVRSATGEPILVIWRSIGAATAVMAKTLASAKRDWLPTGTIVALTDDDDRPVAGRVATDGRPAIRLASNTALPWTVQIFATDDAAEGAAARSRRRLLLAGAGVLLALIVVGAWFVGHTVTRELAVARQQSNFVAGVSHEFRTPLTTLCQMSELLVRGRVANDSDRDTYYRLLHVESQRLRRLVENLLAFGRVDAGQVTFESSPIEFGAFVADAVAEFSVSHPESSDRITVNRPAGFNNHQGQSRRAQDAALEPDRKRRQVLTRGRVHYGVDYAARFRPRRARRVRSRHRHPPARATADF